EIQSAHARGAALGLDTLSGQVRASAIKPGSVVAAVNGDFYKRDGPYAGDSRGLQIVNGELISAPVGGACFWIDAGGQPHTTNVAPQFQVAWPNGTTSPFGLNEERPGDRAVLYTPAAGAKSAIGGGPVLVQGGKKQKIDAGSAESYEFRSMLERHPRTALGWNQRYFYLVEVDGRQDGLSVGMTLNELSTYFAKLGCEE